MGLVQHGSVDLGLVELGLTLKLVKLASATLKCCNELTEIKFSNVPRHTAIVPWHTAMYQDT